MKYNLPKIFVVILNFNGYENTKNCIESLKKVSNSNFKIIVVDNASTDNSVEKLKKNYSDLQYIVSNKNNGYGAGMNAGAKFALENKADLILLTNNDIIFTENFFKPLIDFILKKKNIGIVSPKVIYLDDMDTIYCAGADFSVLHCGGYNPYRGKSSKYHANKVREITFAEGSCLLIKKNVFEKVGFINEKYFMYFEDLDFSEKARKYFEIYYVPDSIIYHKGGAGRNWKNYSPLYYFYNTRNRLFFFSNYNFIIKIYAILFSLLNSIAKSIVLLKTYLLHEDRRDTIRKSINSLWLGMFKGLKIIFAFSEREVN